MKVLCSKGRVAHVLIEGQVLTSHEGPGAGVLIEGQVLMPQGRAGCWCPWRAEKGANAPGKGQVLVGQVLVPTQEGSPAGVLCEEQMLVP
jgi:hypothetical protein